MSLARFENDSSASASTRFLVFVAGEFFAAKVVDAEALAGEAVDAEGLTCLASSASRSALIASSTDSNQKANKSSEFRVPLSHA